MRMFGRPWLFVIAAAYWSLGASYRTENFVVEAPSAEAARQVGVKAEFYRRQKALEWLGQEMPTWGKPCPLKVKITMSGAGGATTFGFDRGAILFQEMNVEGPLDRILASVLPHEITHTVFAYYMREPLPRWADEGGSVLSEDDVERRRHDDLIRRILAGKQPGCPYGFKLRHLMSLKDYPHGNEVMTLYAQGYSLARFLVERGGRPQFLSFVAQGMKHGWDSAIQSHYQMAGVNELEESWLNWMRTNYRPTSEQLAGNSRPSDNQSARTIAQTPVVKNVPGVTAFPVVRGQAPSEEEYVRPTPPVRSTGQTVREQAWSPVYPP